MSAIREKLLSTSARALSKRIITIKLPDPIGELEIMIKSPTVGQRNAMFGELDVDSGKKVKSDKISTMQVKAVIQCALDPATEKPIFEETDQEMLLGMPANGWFDELSSAINDLTAEAQNAAKN